MKMNRRLGICQLCEREHKLAGDNRMVHHGYQRPGDGMGIVGDCPGVGQLPFELSCELVKAHLVTTKCRMENQRDALQRLESADLTTLIFDKHAQRRGQSAKWITLDKRTAAPWEWTQEFSRQTNRAKNLIRLYVETADYLTKKIAGWTLQEIRIVSEESIQALAKSEREDRARLLEEKRAAKKAAQAAIETKRLAREATMAEIVEAARGCFLVIAAERDAGDVSSDETAMKVRILVEELTKKKTIAFGHFWADDLKIDDTLIALGLGHRPPGCRPNFTFNPGYTSFF